MPEIVRSGEFPVVTLKLPDGREQDLQVTSFEMHQNIPDAMTYRSSSGGLTHYMSMPTDLTCHIEARMINFEPENLAIAMGIGDDDLVTTGGPHPSDNREESVMEWLERSVREVRDHG
jgi:hypothetical protein